MVCGGMYFLDGFDESWRWWFSVVAGLDAVLR